MKPEIVPFQTEAEVIAGRHLIRHAADVPVLLSAIASRPDWPLVSGYKPSRFSWLENSADFSWESSSSKARRMGVFSKRVTLRTCRIW